MTEAFFAHVVIVVEGPSEREAIPVFARAQGLDFDEHGVSIVSAGGNPPLPRGTACRLWIGLPRRAQVKHIAGLHK